MLTAKLTFGIAGSLLSTSGASWDYRGSRELVRAMCPSVRLLCENKGKNEDKRLHPLFICCAGPGQGKSRLLMQFPTLARECLDQMTKPRTGEKGQGEENVGDTKVSEEVAYWARRPIYHFVVGLENGTDAGLDVSPCHSLAGRMLWQLRAANEDIFEKHGVPESFMDFMADLAQATSLTPNRVLQGVLREELTSSVVVLTVDSMQKLPGFSDRSTRASTT